MASLDADRAAPLDPEAENMGEGGGGAIRAIDRSSVSRICSGQVITQLATAVKELVENALDAGSTSIEVRLRDGGAESIEVVDNGSGIRPDDFAGLTAKHHTSKIQMFADIYGVKSFGFRGEALSSLCEVCASVHVITRTAQDPVGTRLVFDRAGAIVKRAGSGVGRAAGDRQFVFVNGRPVDAPRLTRAINETWRQYEMKHKPAFVLDMRLPGDQFDINIAPDKREIMFTDEAAIVTAVKAHLDGLWASRCAVRVGAGGLGMESGAGSRGVPSVADYLHAAGSARPLAHHPLARSGTASSGSGGQRGGAHGDAESKCSSGSSGSRERHSAARREGAEGAEGGSDDEEEDFPLAQLLTLRAEAATHGATLPQAAAPPAPSASSAASMGAPSAAPSQSSAPHSPRPRAESGVRRPKRARESVVGSAQSSGEESGVLSLSQLEEELGRSGAGAQNEQGDRTSSPCTEGLKRVRCSTGTGLGVGAQESAHAVPAAGAPAPEIVDTVAGQVRLIREPASSLASADSAAAAVAADADADAEGVEDAEIAQVTSDPGVPWAPVPVPAAAPPPQASSHAIRGWPQGEEALRRPPSPQRREVCDLAAIEAHYRALTESAQAAAAEAPDARAAPAPSPADAASSGLDESTSMQACASAHGEAAARLADRAEAELTRVLTKEAFRRMRLVGQFNKGFMVGRIGSDLFILDQHACDEKVRYEYLSKNTVIHEQPLLAPRLLELTAAEELVILEHLDVFRANGFHFGVRDDAPLGQRLRLRAVPFSKAVTFGVDDIHELASLLMEAPRSGASMMRVPKVRTMLASRACRSAVMIGTALSRERMRSMMHGMADLDQPWNCPHGRPTLRHLVDLAHVQRHAADAGSAWQATQAAAGGGDSARADD